MMFCHLVTHILGFVGYDHAINDTSLPKLESLPGISFYHKIRQTN